jgi:hypothetical protein
LAASKAKAAKTNDEADPLLFKSGRIETDTNAVVTSFAPCAQEPVSGDSCYSVLQKQPRAHTKLRAQPNKDRPEHSGTGHISVEADESLDESGTSPLTPKDCTNVVVTSTPADDEKAALVEAREGAAVNLIAGGMDVQEAPTLDDSSKVKKTSAFSEERRVSPGDGTELAYTYREFQDYFADEADEKWNEAVLLPTPNTLVDVVTAAEVDDRVTIDVNKRLSEASTACTERGQSSVEFSMVAAATTDAQVNAANQHLVPGCTSTDGVKTLIPTADASADGEANAASPQTVPATANTNEASATIPATAAPVDAPESADIKTESIAIPTGVAPVDGEAIVAAPMPVGQQCWLVESEANQGTLVEHWTNIAPERSVAMFVTERDVPKHKLTTNCGRKEVVRSANLGIHKKKYFNGICQFVKEAGNRDGAFQLISEHVILHLHMVDSSIVTVSAGQVVTLSNVDALGVDSIANSRKFAGIATMPKNMFFDKVQASGVALAIGQA